MINHTVSLRQTDQRCELLPSGAGVQLESQPDTLKSDRDFFRNAQSAAEIEIPFRLNYTTPNFDAESRSHCAQRHSCTGNQCFEQHVP